MNEFLRGTKIGRIGKRSPFSLNDIPDLWGKVAVVTGATTGLGKETAIALLKNGAEVVVAARKDAKGEPPVKEVLESIKRSAGVSKDGRLHFIELDLASLSKVKRFADEFLSRFDRLDILVNNAGVSLCPYVLSEDGLELHFAVNHLGHFYLTDLLLETIRKSAPSRIVIVSSRHHHDSYEEGIRLTVEQVNQTKGYDPSKGYGHSKLCNLLFMNELVRRLGNEEVYVNAAHPGFVNAKGITRHIAESMGKFTYMAGRAFQSLVALSVPEGALTQIFLAASEAVESGNIRGQYYGPVAEPYTMASIAGDESLSKELWRFSEQLIQEKG